ncbi:N-acetylglucosaminyldiphosphodolichol N-acetylglucosaminyltransferase catalytic subunit alg13, partial [Cladochytrium tenue]
MRVLVTVGTTRFDDLVAAVASDACLTALVAAGVDELVVQHGACELPASLQRRGANGGDLTLNPPHSDHTGHGTNSHPSDNGWTVPVRGADGRETALRVVAFAYKPSIDEDMAAADLIISHAGSGTVLGALAASKPLIAVPNASLMHNHQVELARALGNSHGSRKGEEVIVSCSIDELVDVVREKSWKNLRAWVAGDPRRFTDFLEDIAGYKTS